MIESELVSETIIAGRLLEAVEYSIGGRWITCNQLALMVERFPGGNRTINEFGTYRVELIVMLFSRIVDIINFDYVLKELNYSEYGMVMFRLGYLNVINPLKIEGAYCLNMSRREEKQLVRILMALSYIEPGDASWGKPVFQLDIGAEPAESETPWHVPVHWYAEDTLPSTGYLSLQYFSGKGIQMEGHAPDPILRHTLMSLVLARPYENDSFANVTSSTLAKANAVLEGMGCKLSFGNVE
jgi:hypothetical protein